MDSSLTKFNLKVQFAFCVIVVGLNYTYGYPQVQEKIDSSKQIRVAKQYVDIGPYNGWCQSCACGIPNRMNRIVGGWTTRVNEYPWVVALSLHNIFFCGGTLINDLYVLTAAHCVYKLRSKDLTVVLSEHNRAIMDETITETRKVSRIIFHDEFNEPIKYNNDIALLKMSSRVKFRNSVAPACLPKPGEDFSGLNGRVTGWGVTQEKGNVTKELMETQIQVLHEKDCHKLPGFGANRVSMNMMCAGLADGGQDACQGDSGGALLIEDWQGRMTTAGIVSWGLGCGRPNKPGIYTRVSNYLEWIVSKTLDGCYCF